MNTMKKLDLRYNLKCILRDRGMSQVELAEKLGMSPTNLNTRLARGKRCQIDLLDSISKILEVGLDELMTGQASSVANQSQNSEEDDMLKDEMLQLQRKLIVLMEENTLLKTKLALADAQSLTEKQLG